MPNHGHRTTPTGSLFSFLRRRFVYWWMGRVAGRWCPCEWPIKSRRLIHICSRIDDAHERYEFMRFAAFHTGRYGVDRNITTSSNADVKVTWNNDWTPGGKP